MRVVTFVLLTIAVYAEQLLTHTEVFRAGVGGYHSYWIPTLLTTSNGTLLAFAEKWSASNPTPVLDRSNHRIWIFFNRWQPGYGSDKSEPGMPHNQMRAHTSDDEGVTWSEACDLTRDSRDYEHWGAMFLGPGGAIQAKSGRLLIPASMKADLLIVQATIGGFTGTLGLMRAYIFYSDDHGQSWKRGALAAALTNENQLVELADGKLLMDARQNNGDHRWFLTSADGGQSWLRPRVGMQVSALATAI